MEQGPGVFEIVGDRRGDTYRAVYTVRFRDIVYVLHAFQKKSPSGIRTPKRDIELVRWVVPGHVRPMTKLQSSGACDKRERISRCDMAKPKTRIRVTPSSGNVFSDLRLRNAAEKQTRVRLAAAINDTIWTRRLTQAEAARLLSINQPKISALLNYRLQGFSVERLMNFLTALDRDVEIVIRNRARTRKAGQILVTAA